MFFYFSKKRVFSVFYFFLTFIASVFGRTCSAFSFISRTEIAVDTRHDISKSASAAEIAGFLRPGAGLYVGFTLMWEPSMCGFRAGEAWGAQRAGFVRGTKGAIAIKIKHAIKLKASPARLTHLLHNRCGPH